MCEQSASFFDEFSVDGVADLTLNPDHNGLVHLITDDNAGTLFPVGTGGITHVRSFRIVLKRARNLRFSRSSIGFSN